MKHEEIYHTCDRCGKKIDILPNNADFLMRKLRKTVNAKQYKIISADTQAYVANLERESPDIDAITIEILCTYRIKNNEIELCGDCRKAFERFMRNENNI